MISNKDFSFVFPRREFVTQEMAIRLRAITQMLWDAFTAKDELPEHDQGRIERQLAEISQSEEIGPLDIGSGALCLFIRTNFTGPALSKGENVSQEELFSKLVAKNSLRLFEIHDLNPTASALQLLYIAKLTLFSSPGKATCDPVLMLWQLRFYKVLTHLTDSLEDSLFIRVSVLIQKLDGYLKENCHSDSIKTLIYFEFCHLLLNFGCAAMAQEYLSRAKQLQQVDTNLVGRLGMRTKYQQNALPQLMVEMSSGPSSHSSVAKDELNEFFEGEFSDINVVAHQYADRFEIKDVKTDDDVRLDKLKIVECPENVASECLPLGEEMMCRAIVLSSLALDLRSGPHRDEVSDEQRMAYVDYLLRGDNMKECWSIQFAALFHRSRLELVRNSRAKERAIAQLEELGSVTVKVDLRQSALDVVDEALDSKVAFSRLFLFFVSNLPSRWKVRQTLADSLIMMNLIKSALEIYESLQDWGKVIECLLVTDRKPKAEELARKLLAESETPKHWMLLGQATTEDITCYEKAWELSNHRYSPAQRALGNHFFYREEFPRSIECYKKFTELNSLDYSVWFRLGFASFHVKDYSLAVDAYRHCSELDSASHECWNNLAKAYIHLGKFEQARRALHESLRCQYDSWRIWDNLLSVSAQLGHLDDLAQCFKRLSELKPNMKPDPRLVELAVHKALQKKSAGDDGVADDADVGEFALDKLDKLQKQESVDPENEESVEMKEAVESEALNESERVLAVLTKVQALLNNLSKRYPDESWVWLMMAELPDHQSGGMILDKAKWIGRGFNAESRKTGWYIEPQNAVHVLGIAVRYADAVVDCVGKIEESESRRMLGSVKLSLNSALSLTVKSHTNALTGEVSDVVKEAVDQLRQRVESVKEKLSNSMST